MRIKILIPVYRKEPTEEEMHSFRQCVAVLNRYPIAIITYPELDLQHYSSVLEAANVSFLFEYFDKAYFDSVNSYSRLLLSRQLYDRFKEDEYIFIYQLDAYVFRDELEEWCQKEFDYIGAPWFKHYGMHETGDDLYKVGNGGVSLRKIDTFRTIFDKKLPFSVYPFFVKNIRRKRILLMSFRTLKMLFLLLFTRRSVEFYLQHYTDERINEDCFWADGLSRTSLALKVPDVMIAAQFCIEKSPSYLYQLLGEKLPFACHAYEKYEYEKFWKKFIK